MSSEVCVNCEEPIGHTPVFFDGKAYCCVGCVAGGPCLCTYSDEPTPVLPTPEADPGPIRPSVPNAPAASVVSRPTSPTGPTAQPPQSGRRAAPAVAAKPIAQAHPSIEPLVPESRDPIPFRRPGNVAVIVQAIGFAGQRDLLAFAALVEDEPTFTEVSLTRVTPTEAWFALRTSSPESAASAIRQFAGFRVDTFVDQNVVEVRIASAFGAQGGRPGEPPHPAESAEPLLPPRPRFRVFRPGPNDSQLTAPGRAPQSPASQTPTPQAPVPPQQPAAAPPMAPRVTRVPEVPGVPPTPAAHPPHAPQQAPTPPERPAAQTPPAQPPQAPPAPAIPARPPVDPTDIPRTEARPAGPTPAAPVPRSAPGSEPDRPATVQQPAAFAQDDEDGGVVNPDARPGGAVLTVEHMTLVAYPFHSFAALNDFQGAIRKLHGVTNTRVRRFYRGTLHLAVDYEDMIPLSERLRDLKGFNFEVASESRSEIELVLEDSGSLVAAGEN